MKFGKNWLTPARACSWMGKTLPEHITYNPALTRLNGAQFDMVRESKHDGSGNFTADMLRDSLGRLILKQVCDTRLDRTGAIDIKYEVGTIRNAAVYGASSMRERMRIPVKCILIYPEQTPLT